MLSYQHAYHAGNRADLHKHAVLAALLAQLTRKPRPITYLESHAGRGLYDLGSAEAAKTGEAAEGIARAEPSGAYAQALAATRAVHGPAAYPGSPAIAAALLRPDDRILLCELHPGEHAALKAALGARAEIHRRDGHEGLPALCPPSPRRGLALIDPSYEVKSEYAEAAETACATLARWPEGVVLVWYPILPEARHHVLTDRLARLPGLVISETRFLRRPERGITGRGITGRGITGRGMTGSGLAILNPPYGTEAAIAAVLDPFSEILVGAPK